MEATTSRRKRNRKSDGSDSDGERRRGRPRVEKPDESAADRRRTQIRMAQRAYRQRKESTLDELRKRVSDYINTIELMNKTFIDCRDRLFASDLSEEQMLDLHDVTVQFQNFVKDARNPSEEPMPASEQPSIKHTHVRPEASNRAEARRESVDEAVNVPLWLDQSAVANVAKPRDVESVDIGMGYQMYLPGVQDDFQQAGYASFEAEDQQMISLSNTDLNSFQARRLDIPDTYLSPNISLESPRTYSFQESTFGRRLFRASVEAAYRLLLDPSRKPSEYERIFRLSLMGRDKEKLIASFKSVLARGPHEDLDFWEAPLIHIGGAGTHYPRKDAFGNYQAKKEAQPLGLIGPQALALLENAARDKISADMTVEIAGFEGEWYDPYDVEGYLEEKGIFIDPSASFAEVEIVEWSPTPSSASSGSGFVPHTPTTIEPIVSLEHSTPFTGGQLAWLNDARADLSQWNDFSNMELGAVGFSDAHMGSWMNFLQPGESIKEFNGSGSNIDAFVPNNFSLDKLRNPPKRTPMFASSAHTPPHDPRRKNVIIDVAKFVEVLIVSGACLGRSPGFRRRDVDRALAISSFDAF